MTRRFVDMPHRIGWMGLNVWYSDRAHAGMQELARRARARDHEAGEEMRFIHRLRHEFDLREVDESELFPIPQVVQDVLALSEGVAVADAVPSSESALNEDTTTPLGRGTVTSDRESHVSPGAAKSSVAAEPAVSSLSALSEGEWPSPAGPSGLVKAGKTDAKSTAKIGTSSSPSESAQLDMDTGS